LDADYASPRFQAGQILLSQGRPDEALAQFREALDLQPDNFQMLVFVARVRASAGDPRLRDGAEALSLAQRAVKGGANAMALDALAMAYAENGRLDEARRFGQQACDLAGPSSSEGQRLRDHLEAYRQGNPWREPAGKF